MKNLLILFALLTILCVQSYPEDVIPIRIANNRFLIVDGLVNDRFPSRFILDTGAGLEVVSGKFFDKIKDTAAPAGILTAFQSVGSRVDLELYRVPSLQIGSYVKKDLIIAPYSDLDSYVGIDGLISLKFFEDRPFTLDFVSRRLILETPNSLESLAAQAEVVPIYESSFTGIGLDIFLPLVANGRVSLLAKFDTGTGLETMIHPHFMKALGIEALSDGVIKRSFRNPDGNSQPWYVSQISSLSPANSRLIRGTNLTVNFLKDFIYEGLIGWQLFKYSLVTIDVPNRRLLVRENPVKPKSGAPQVVRMFPSSDATDVPVDVQEIYVEFDRDMGSTICLNLHDDKQREILFKNAYWKTDKILAIKIEGRLKPKTRYDISLGIPDLCQLMDNFGGLFPVTGWNFKTR